MKRIFYLLLCSSTGSLISNAQVLPDTTTGYSAQNLSEITIQENRLQIPFSEQNRNVSIIDQKIIKTLPVKSVNELLAYVAGLDVRQRGPWGVQTDISMDGGTFDQTLVLLNGVKISDPQTGHNMMNLPVSIDAIERIEILKGAAASVYGINALNGAINIITRQPDATGVAVNVYGGSAFRQDTSNNRLFAGYGMDITASLAGRGAQHFLALSTMQSSGYRYNSATHTDRAFYQNKINLGGQKTLSFMGGLVYNRFGANGFYSPPADVESQETVSTGIAGIEAVLPVNRIWTIRPAVSYRYNADDYIFIRQHPEVYENRHYTNVMDGALNNTFKTGIGTLGVGAEVREEAINSSNLGKWNRINYGFFGEYGFDRVKNLSVNIGIYANYNEHFGWQVLPGIDAGYLLLPHVRLFANAGTGERLPTYTDWYYKGPDNIGNDQLMPERAFHSEAGIKYDSKALHVTASYFYRVTSDFIDWVKDSLNAPWQPQNFQQIKMPGISVSADYRLTPAARGYSLLAGLSYTWLDPHIQKGNGEAQGDKISQYALENLRHQLCVRGNIGFAQHFSFTLAARYEQRVSYKDYVLLDTRAEASLQRFVIYADLTNITNVQYVGAGAVPMPGRWLTLGLRWTFWK